MDPGLYKAATQGNVHSLKDIIAKDPKIIQSVTPQDNTVLHIAARLGHKKFAEEILKEWNTLLILTNAEDDTPLHVAARAGHLDVVASLINYAVLWPTEIPSEQGPLRMTNKMENTPLHEAVRHRNSAIAMKLLSADPVVGHLVNSKKETPLHIAAREGLVVVVREILQHPWVEELEELQPPPSGTGSPLHQAVLGGHISYFLNPRFQYAENVTNDAEVLMGIRRVVSRMEPDMMNQIQADKEMERYRLRLDTFGTAKVLNAIRHNTPGIVEILLNEREDLINVVDDSGNNALHYAAQKNSGKMVEMLLRREPSFAYVTNREGRSPLHVAAAYGSTFAIKEILKHCPDAAEQVDQTGKNALHIAVMNRTVGSLKCLLKNIQPVEIINQVDSCGNTPLHLAAKQARIQSSLLLLKDKRVDPCIVNMEGFTARNIIESLEEMDTYEMYIWRALKKSEAERCKKQRFIDDGISRSFKKKMSTADEHFKSSAETYTLVAALIATVTFAATFTMPGGFDQKSGMALLVRHPAFKVFVISNTVAMCSSLVVVFCFIWAWKDPVRFKLNQLTWGHRLTVVACLAMLVTLMTAVYLVVADECHWLAAVVCLICCSAPILVWAILGHDVLFIPL